MAPRDRPLCALLFLALLTLVTPAAALPPEFSVRPVFTNVAFPTTIRFAPDGRLFFTELGGRVAFYPSPTSPTSTTWATLDIDNVGESGVLGLAIHPNFPDSAYVYVCYTRADPHGNRLVRFRDSMGQGVEPATLMQVLTAVQWHHGGRVEFGPDGMIYFTNGDLANPDPSQDPATPNGKIFRLGRGGAPAPGNPWGPLNPAALLGVRNAYGLCFDSETGTGYFTENGPECDDEVNLLSLGANYGWSSTDPCGSQPVGVPALASFTPTIAPTGCCVYRGDTYPSFYKGSLFFGSFNQSRVYRMRFAPGRPDLVDSLEVFVHLNEPVLDVTVGPDGLLWIATTNTIYKITYPGTVGVPEEPVPGRGISLRVAPNPSRGSVVFDASDAPDGSQLEVFDLTGRRVRHWSAPIAPSTSWDGRDDAGAAAPPGVYLVRITGQGVEATRRLVRLGP